MISIVPLTHKVIIHDHEMVLTTEDLQELQAQATVTLASTLEPGPEVSTEEHELLLPAALTTSTSMQDATTMNVPRQGA